MLICKTKKGANLIKTNEKEKVQNWRKKILLERSWSSGYTRIQRLCFIFIEGTRVFTLYTMNFAGEYRRRQILYSPVFQNYFSSNRGKYRRRQISYSPVFQNFFSSIWRKYFGYFCISLGRYNYLSLYSPCNSYIPLIQKFLQLKHIAKWMVYIHWINISFLNLPFCSLIKISISFLFLQIW